MSLYKTAGGGWVFGAGTIQLSWGLDANHDRAGSATDLSMQQATINLFSDMGIQPGTLLSTLVLGGPASTDVTPPVSIITFPANGATFPEDSVITITGTASDVGGVVGGVEISVDGGTTWQPAQGTTNWTFIWTPSSQGSITIKSRAVDDSGNLEAPGGSEGSANTVNVTITSPRPPTNCPCTIIKGPPQGPALVMKHKLNDGLPLTLGVKFKAGFDGFISAIRFYKSVGDTAHNKVILWSAAGDSLGSATLTGNPLDTGWREVSFINPIEISANTVYVASYFSPTGFYSATSFGFSRFYCKWSADGACR